MTPLVLVHGFMGGSAQWALQEPELTRDRKVIAVDLPGFGKNAKMDPIGSIEGFADWVLSYLSAEGVHSFDLLGHSMGGMIAQEMVHRAPERIKNLVLYGTGATGRLPGRFETIAQSKLRFEQDGPALTARRISATWFVEGEAASEFENCAAIARMSAAGALPIALDAMDVWRGEDRLETITAETLILWGDCDRTYAWSQIEKLWTSIERSSLAVVPKCAHAVHLEEPDIFMRLVHGFLSIR